MNNHCQITVVVVVRNEKEYIEQCLDSLALQDYINIRVHIIDSSSTDGTSSICEAFVQRHEQFSYTKIPYKGIGFARAFAFAKTATQFLAFLDGDCVAPRDWLSKLYEGYLRNKNHYPSLAAVGGSHRTLVNATFQNTLELFKSSLLGSGSSTYRSVAKKDKSVYHIPTANVLYDHTVLTKVFPDKHFEVSNEDVDISYQIVSMGGVLVQLAESFVWHKMQESVFLWSKSIYRYGYGKMQLMMKHRCKRISLLVFLVPLLFLITGMVTLVFFPILCMLLCIGYGIIICAESLRLSYTSFSLSTFCLLCILFPITHISYALGEMVYLLRFPFYYYSRA